MAQLKDKIILVTGATGTIGQASALRLAKEGATVVLVGRKAQKLNELYDLIVAEGGADPAIVNMDFAKTTNDDFYGLTETLEGEFGRLDGIVHAAVNLANLTPLAHVNPEKWLLSLNITLNTPFYLTQALLPLLFKAEKRASVIFFDHEEVAKGDKAYWGSYAVAKAGLSTLMKLFASEFASQDKIQFNSIDPICINSALRYSVMPSGSEESKDINLVTDLIVHLNQDHEAMITGETFRL